MMPKIAIAGMQAVSDLLFPSGIVKENTCCSIIKKLTVRRWHICWKHDVNALHRF